MVPYVFDKIRVKGYGFKGIDSSMAVELNYFVATSLYHVFVQIQKPYSAGKGRWIIVDEIVEMYLCERDMRQ